MLRFKLIYVFYRFNNCSFSYIVHEWIILEIKESIAVSQVQNITTTLYAWTLLRCDIFLYSNHLWLERVVQTYYETGFSSI